MVAGRELDALVAAKVMGEDTLAACPPFSTDLIAAWMVVERLKNSEYMFRLRCSPICPEVQAFFSWFEIPHHGFECSASTAPLAICLAALKAVGVRSARKGAKDMEILLKS